MTPSSATSPARSAISSRPSSRSRPPAPPPRAPPANPTRRWTALATALDERFFTQARALKRATAISALRRLLASARAAAEAAAPAGQDFAAAGAALARLEQAVRAALDGERIALRARLDETYRRAALEVREFVRPRSWLFGEHRATAADEAFLGELLEDSVTGALARTRAALVAAVADDQPPAADARAIAAAVDQAIDRFAAYARGVIDGGAVPDFFRHQLPRLRLEVGAIRDALMRRAPDPEQALFAPLRRERRRAVRRLRARAGGRGDGRRRRARRCTRRASPPLAALAQVIDALEQNGRPRRRRSAHEREAEDDGADGEQRRRDDHDAVAEPAGLLPRLREHHRTDWRRCRWPPSAASAPAIAGWNSGAGVAEPIRRRRRGLDRRPVRAARGATACAPRSRSSPAGLGRN